MRSCRWLPLAFVSAGALTVSGCGGTKLVDVQGTVTLNGKPLDNAQVQFLPDPGQKTAGIRSTGDTDEEGRFKLICDDKRGGAAVGMHRVLVVDLKQWEGIRPGREDSNKPLKPSRIPARYSDALKTPFSSIEVKAQGSPIALDVKTP